MRLSQFLDSGENNLLFGETTNAVFERCLVDDMIGKATIEGRGGEVAALKGTQEQLLTLMEKLSPQYQQARTTYAQMSRPINQMDIGQEFSKRLMPALYRDMDAPAQLNAAAFARALTDQGDDIARSVTGMKGARLDSIMEPQQLQALRGVAGAREVGIAEAGEVVADAEPEVVHRPDADREPESAF
jgi:hypothetical protein